MGRPDTKYRMMLELPALRMLQKAVRSSERHDKEAVLLQEMY